MAADKLRAMSCVDLDDVKALEHCAANKYEPYYTLKILIVRLESDGPDVSVDQRN